VFILYPCFVGGRGKGGGGTGGGNGWRGATVFIPSEEYPGPSNWEDRDGIPVWTWAVISTVSIFIFGALIWLFYRTYTSCKKKRCEETLVTCYLCKKRVAQGQWKQGIHRQKCAEMQKDTLRLMKSPENNKIRFPKCRARLKLWPANHGPPFACSSSNCPIVGRIRSTGQNRFNCFSCNFDLCESCVNRKLGKTVMGWEEEQRRRALQIARDSWYFGPSSASTHEQPSAPQLDYQEEEPPPSYHQAIIETKSF